MGRINQYPKASVINDSDTLLGVVGGTTKQVAKDVLLSGVTSDISNTTIVGKKAGKVITADDSSNNRLPELTAYGKSVQDTYSGKNNVESIATSRTEKGIEFVVNSDKSITVNGTATETVNYKVTDNLNVKIGDILSGCPSGGSISKYELQLYSTENKVSGRDFGDGGVITKDDVTTLYIIIRSGVTVNNLTFYPMVRDSNITDATYEPYVGGEASPNPSFPQSITSVADDKSLVVKSCGKNLLEFDTNKNSYIVEGITFTIAEDNKITVNGTSTGYSDLFFRNRTNLMFLPKGEYIWSGCPSGGSESNYYMLLMRTNEDGTSNRVATDYGNGVTFTIEEDIYVYTIARVMKGTTVNNLVYAPMLRLADIEDATYEPYVSTEATLTLTDSLRGIPVAEGGNYTDENGQQWVCDSVEKYADGTGMYIQRIYHKVFNGEQYFTVGGATTRSNYFNYTNVNIAFSTKGKCTGALCTRLSEIDADYLWVNDVEKFAIDYQTHSIRMRFKGITDVATLQAQLKAWYDAGEPMEFICELAEPIETDLTAAQMAELEKLQSFNPYTTVDTDDIGDIAITYFKNSDSGKIVGSLNDRISNLVALLQSNGVI